MANWWLLDQVFKTNCFSKLDDKFSEENKYMPVVATVIDVKKAATFDENGEKKTGFIHCYYVDERSEVYKDSEIFDEEMFMTGEKVECYIKKKVKNDSDKLVYHKLPTF